MITRLAVFDFDGTLIDSPEPELGKVQWSEKKGIPYPYEGWWGRPESLDLDVFNIKPFPSVLLQLKRELVTPNTYVIILTSRMEKLRPQVEAVLDANHIKVNKVDMKRVEDGKGDKRAKVMRYVQELPDLKTINVYEDRETDLASYEILRSKLPEGIELNVYVANHGQLALTESSHKYNILEIILEEIQNLKQLYL